MKERTQNVKTVGNGEGSLYVDSKTDRLVFQYTTPSGKRPRIKQKKNEKAKDFRARVTKIKNQLNDGTYIEKDTTTLYNYISKIIEDKLKRNLVTECTYSRDIQTLNILKKTTIINKPIQKITVLELQETVDGFSNYSNSVINKIYQIKQMRY